MEQAREDRNFTFPVRMFYGKNAIESNVDEKRQRKIETFPRKWPRLLDPTATWKIFKRQQEALDYVHIKKMGLMTFAFQDKFGHRLFLAAHPTVFWFYDTKRDLQDRCSYEIIVEYSVCKLYFDLEFNIKHNYYHDGNRMIDSFIKIVSYFLKETWNIIVNRQDILDLDSTTKEKFSRHLVFIIPNVAFQDNYNVGNFVKYVCSNIRDYLGECKSDQFCNVDKSNVNELLISDGKGSSKLFCDEGVYTKNRHFRLYMSTKQNRNAPLRLSIFNQYKPNKKTKEQSFEETLFLDSLITYIQYSVDKFQLLKFKCQNFTGGPTSKECSLSCSSNIAFEDRVSILNGGTSSPYPDVDKFINSLVSPGRIWRSLYFNSTSHLVYDIVGYRYCGNIGREHRSNNIKYIVNLENYTYYQKCHDPECLYYRSAMCPLPSELVFLLEDDTFLDSQSEQIFSPTIGYFGILEEEFVQVVEAVEYITHDFLEDDSLLTKVPDFGVSDHDLSLALDDLQT
ncbi:hypothetical protein C0J52_11102 [Blattella germanica]|nr:hypothetical protein C0J52_11102 [Blattella germanica]